MRLPLALSLSPSGWGFWVFSGTWEILFIFIWSLGFNFSLFTWVLPVPVRAGHFLAGLLGGVAPLRSFTQLFLLHPVLVVVNSGLLAVSFSFLSLRVPGFPWCTVFLGVPFGAVGLLSMPGLCFL